MQRVVDPLELLHVQEEMAMVYAALVILVMLPY
jgi:hypothetical protein